MACGYYYLNELKYDLCSFSCCLLKLLLLPVIDSNAYLVGVLCVQIKCHNVDEAVNIASSNLKYLQQVEKSVGV